MTQNHNPYSGRRAPGYRFCFHVRAIAHRSLFLPLSMRPLPEIQRLLKGESPLSVFECSSYQEARRRFAELRKRYDFAFWAATEYMIIDIDDPDEIIPLRLNPYQHLIIDTFQRRYHDRQLGRYVISKSIGHCGVTTCVQAYILWCQTYQCRNQSCVYAPSEISLYPLKANLSRYLGRDTVFTDRRIYLPDVDGKAHFNTYRNPNAGRGINFCYVHLADMSKWRDPDGRLTTDAFRAAGSGVLLEYFTLVVFEGNVPTPDRFPIHKYQNQNLPYKDRLLQLRRLSNNPAFLSYVTHAANPHPNSPLHHIDLDALSNSAEAEAVGHSTLRPHLPGAPSVRF